MEVAEKSSAPARSIEQRMEALTKANDVRSRRAALKRGIRAGREDPRALLLDPPAYIETMKVWELLFAIPKYGRTKVNRRLAQIRVSPSKTVGGLSDRQRRELAEMLPQRDERERLRAVL